MNGENDTKVLQRASLRTRKTYIVKTAKFRCMAYRDDKGTWRDYFNGDEIAEEVTVVSEA